MVLLRSDVRTLLNGAESHLRVGSAAQLSDAVTRSHLADFRCVGWYGSVPEGCTVVIDAEYAGAAVPGPLAGRFGTDGFWERWTRAECLCKLADVPMLAWWPAHGLDVPADFTGDWRTLRLPTETGELVVSVAIEADSAVDPERHNDIDESLGCADD
jgi:hypothetical protein